MGKFIWQNGSQVEPAKVEIEGVSYDVVDAQYEGETPLSASNLNLMQDEIFDWIYPVGSYYETSDTSFNPNVSWRGTWVEDTEGLVTVSQSVDEEFDTVGKTGGEKAHMQTQFEQYWTNRGNNATGTGATGGYLVDHSSTNQTAFNILQPYIVVKRWHRTA